LRTVFLGTSDFAVTVLDALVASAHAVALVVTRPARPRGRGRRLAPPPVADAARGHGIEVLAPERLDAAADAIGAARPDALSLCAYGAIVREPLLSAWEIFNVHPSLLPRWRGAAPVERALLAGDEETGVSIMRLVAELDAGPVAVAGREPVGPEDTYGTLAPRLATLGGELLVRALAERPAWREQLSEGVTYAEKIGAEDRELRPAEEDAAALDRRVRALTPHIGAWVALDGERLGVRAARPAPAGPAPGELDGARLGTTDGALDLLEVQPPGKRPMAAADWLRGRR